jgi:hypothetical protein
VDKQFTEFFQNPTASRYEELLKEQVAAPGYSGHEDYVELKSMISDDKMDEAAAELERLMTIYPLSPRLHLLASYRAEAIGNKELEEREQEIGFACLEAILSTGDGSEAKPYLCSKVSDEYDVLGIVLREEVEQQSLVQLGEKTCDKFLCQSGAEVHFDISLWYGSY